MLKGWKAALAACAMTGTPALAQEAMDAPPVAPKGAVASLVLPPHDAEGFATPNRGLTAAETVWHLRTALNVAALACRGPAEAETVAGYNALIAAEKSVLVTASDGVGAAYKVRFGAAWQARYDDDMTRLYNFWAQPAAQQGFCAVADTVLRDASTVEPGDFAAFAATALPRLEAPFLAFFADVEAYRTAQARWDAARTQAAAVEPGLLQVAAR